MNFLIAKPVVWTLSIILEFIFTNGWTWFFIASILSLFREFNILGLGKRPRIVYKTVIGSNYIPEFPKKKLDLRQEAWPSEGFVKYKTKKELLCKLKKLKCKMERLRSAWLTSWEYEIDALSQYQEYIKYKARYDNLRNYLQAVPDHRKTNF